MRNKKLLPIKESVVRVRTYALDQVEQAALRLAMKQDILRSKKRRLQCQISRTRDVSLVLFLLNTGLPPEDLLSLTLDDIDLSERIALVGQHVVHLNPEMLESLKEWLNVRVMPDNDRRVWFLFKARGAREMKSRVIAILGRYRRLSGIRSLTPAVLIYTYLTNQVTQEAEQLFIAAYPVEQETPLVLYV